MKRVLRCLKQARCLYNVGYGQSASIGHLVQSQAETVAQERLQPIAHSMALEDQAVEESLHKLQLAMAANSLLEDSRRELW